MPCNSDYMNASDYERQISRVACLLDELNGQPLNKSDWSGYHPKVYNRATRELGDRLTKRLCDKLKHVDVSKYSLEMQMWWRDHKAADAARVKREKRIAKDIADRKAALAKLTPRERALLKVED